MIFRNVEGEDIYIKSCVKLGDHVSRKKTTVASKLFGSQEPESYDDDSQTQPYGDDYEQLPKKISTLRF